MSDLNSPDEASRIVNFYLRGSGGLVGPKVLLDTEVLREFRNNCDVRRQLFIIRVL